MSRARLASKLHWPPLKVFLQLSRRDTGADGALPVMRQVREEGRSRKLDLVVLPTAEAISALAQTTKDIHAILHLTC